MKTNNNYTRSFGGCELILRIFNEQAVGLLRDTCESIMRQTIPCKKTVGYASETRQELLDLIHEFPFDEFIMTPEHTNPYPAQSHKWLYDRSEAHYVAFIQGDDQCAPKRMQSQIETLRDYPDAAICFAGILRINNHDYSKPMWEWFKYNHFHLFNIGYPSCWLIDKWKVPKLPLVEGFEHPREWCWDFYIISPIMMEFDAVVMREPLIQYHMHDLNNSAVNSQQTKMFRKNELVEYYRENRDQIKTVHEVKSYILPFPLHMVQQYLFQIEKGEIEPPQRILVIGSHTPDRACSGYSRALANRGHTVIRANVDQYDQDVEWNISVWKEADFYHSRSGLIDDSEIERILAEEGADPFDFILICQNHILHDIRNCVAPVYYWHHTNFLPDCPLGNVTGFLYGYHGAEQDLYWIDTPNAEQCKIHKDLLYAIDWEQFTPDYDRGECILSFSERQTKLGIKGSRQIKEGKHTTQMQRDVYTIRNRFIDHAEVYHSCVWEDRERANPRIFLKKYKEFYHNTQIALNCAGRYGGINNRQFEAIAMGCILLQYRYDTDQLYKLGFIDTNIEGTQGNCFLFSNTREMTAKLNWIKSHPRKALQVRDNGMELVFHFHQFKHRVADLMKHISRYSRAEKDRQYWIENSYDLFMQSFPSATLSDAFPVICEECKNKYIYHYAEAGKLISCPVCHGSEMRIPTKATLEKAGIVTDAMREEGDHE